VSGLGKILLCIFIAGFCIACTTTASKTSAFDLSEILQAPDVVTLPYEVTEAGLFQVEVGIGEKLVSKMILDTGATRSAIYKHLQNQLDIGLSGETIRIHGMVESGLRPELISPYIKIGGRKLEGLSVAVLEDLPKDSHNARPQGGIIGLDILADYYVYFDNQSGLLSLIPRHYTHINLPPEWLRVHLKNNPFGLDMQTLKYMDIRVTGKIVPALFDTGSEINAINWSAINHPQIKLEQRRLRKNCRLRGAVGEFDPKVKIRLVKFRSGQKFWDLREFIVLNFQSLDVLGVNDQAFMIAGANMFSDTSFWLDLKGDEILFDPTEGREKKAS